ncbi:MAG: DUF2148 domain-containing protein [bacterium]
MQKAILAIADKMILAAKTAPKARGLDFIEAIVIFDKNINKLSEEMRKIGQRETHQTFLRDGANILKAEAIVLIGTKKKTIGLKYCGFCGFKDCQAAEKAGAVCALNSGDLGIAIGSAVSIAMDNRVDNRVMYSAGKAAIEAGLLGKEVVIAYGIPLSATAKNPFFDRS